MKEQIENTKEISCYEAKTYGWAQQEQLLLVPNYLDLIGDLNGKSVLDVGCGNGWLTYLIGQKAKSVLGCDVSADMIKIAREEYSSNNIKYEVLDASSLNSLNERFDVILCSLMLHASQSYDSMVQTLISASNLLEKNGKMVILVPHPCFSMNNKRPYNTYTFSDSFNYFNKNETYDVNLVSNKGVTRFSNKFYNLQDYFDAFRKSGFLVSQIVEPQVSSEYKDKKELWTSEFEIPFYLIFEIVKGRTKNE